MKWAALAAILICLTLCGLAIPAVRADRNLPALHAYPTPYLPINPHASAALPEPRSQAGGLIPPVITIRHSFQPQPLTEFLHYHIIRQGGAAMVLRREYVPDAIRKPSYHAVIIAALDPAQAERIHQLAQTASPEQRRRLDAEARLPAPNSMPPSGQLGYTAIVVRKPEVRVFGITANEGVIHQVAWTVIIVSSGVSLTLTAIILPNPFQRGRRLRSPARPRRPDNPAQE